MEAMAQTAITFPTAEETINHPAYPGAIWSLEPHQSGTLACAKDRSGPINIAWEIHGVGPKKLVLVMGLAGVKSSWQRQTKHFGHDLSSEYCVLLVDNRGMGASDKPLMRYSTSEMAKDLIEVFDHVGWTEPRSLHLVGISLGGMISQELACLIPERLSTLTLLCTAATVENTKSFHKSWQDRIQMAIPKSPERAIEDTSRQLFTDEWLTAPDEAAGLPDESTPKCGPANGGKGYLKFETNFQRFQAQELTKRRDAVAFTRTGYLMQLIAAGWHRKTDEQLKAMADQVGRERIAIMHGTRDNMIDVYHGRKLIEYVEPGVGMIVEGLGHAPVMERVAWFNEFLAERVRAGEKLDGRA